MDSPQNVWKKQQDATMKKKKGGTDLAHCFIDIVETKNVGSDETDRQGESRQRHCNHSKWPKWNTKYNSIHYNRTSIFAHGVIVTGVTSQIVRRQLKQQNYSQCCYSQRFPQNNPLSRKCQLGNSP